MTSTVTSDEGSASSTGSARTASVDPGTARRTVAYFATLVLLFVLAQVSVDRPVIIGAAVLNLVAATVWVRGQYADWLHDHHSRIHWKTLAAAALATVVAAVVLSGSLGTVILASVIAAYVVAGFAVVHGRERIRSFLVEKSDTANKHDRRRLWLTLTGALAGITVLVVVAFSLLGSGRGGWVLASVVLVAVPLLLVLPPLVSLVSEAAIVEVEGRDKLSRARRFRRSAVRGMVIGAAGVVLAGFAVERSAGSLLALVAMAALFLLVLAIVSGTLADVAAVIAVVALLGVTPAPASETPAMRPQAEDGRVLVALGDSYMSGEGASIFYEGTDVGGTNTCHRAPSAWAAILGQQGMPFDAVHFIACSGARTYNVRLQDSTAKPPSKPQDGEGRTQLEQYRAHRADERRKYRPALVILGIGGNDAGFATIGLTCLAPGDCSALRNRWMTGLDRVGQALEETFAEVRRVFPSTPVVVPLYPRPIFPTARDGCDGVALTAPEREFISDFVIALNVEVAQAAEKADFHVVTDMQSALAESRLQLCDPDNDDRPGINFIGLRSVAGLAEQRFNPGNWAHNSLHPNERGHAAMLRTFTRWLPKNGRLTPAARAPDYEAIAPGEVLEARLKTATGTVPECELYSDGPDGCKERGQAWALQQIGALALSWQGLAVPLYAGFAWVFCVAFFAWRRSRAAERVAPAARVAEAASGRPPR